jgi:hypothetical protein
VVSFGQPPAQSRIVRSAFLVGGDQFTVEHSAGSDLTGYVAQLGEPGRDVPEGAVLEVQPPVRLNEEKAAQPVPFDLEEVFVGAEGRLRRYRLHWPDSAWKRVQLYGELVNHR